MMRLVRMPQLTLIVVLLTLLMLPKTALAHALSAPAELITTLLDKHSSGPFTIGASQFASAEMTELEVQVMAFGGALPEDVTVQIEAISAETATPFSATLIRHHDAFTTTLPLNGENWAVQVSVASEIGMGSAELTITPYRAPVETPPHIRAITFGAPALIALVALIGIKTFGFNLTSSAPPQHNRRSFALTSETYSHSVP